MAETAPFAFTEAGVAMLSSVLKSQTAIEMNIAIMRTFVALRKVASNYKEIMQILTDMRLQYDARFDKLYTVLEQLINPPPPPERGLVLEGLMRKTKSPPSKGGR